MACYALLLGLLGSCTHGRAEALRPDLAGTWDLVYDDVLDVEVTLGREVHRGRVGRTGGRVALHDAGAQVEIEIDCTRSDVLCPNEVLDTQLVLTNRLGDVDDDGENLMISLQGEGQGPCRLHLGSAAEARIETQGAPDAKTFRGIALSDGKVTSILSGACLAQGADGKVTLEHAVVKLAVGFSAARR